MCKKDLKAPNTITAVLPNEMASEFRDLCLRTGITQTNAIRFAVREFLPKLRKQAKSNPPSDSEVDAIADTACDALWDAAWDETF